MPQQSKARARLAQLLEARRLDLGLRWTDVAEAAELTTETLRQVRFSDREIRPLTARAIENVMGWEAGSIRAVLGGADPILRTVDPDVSPQPEDVGYVSRRDALRDATKDELLEELARRIGEE